MALDTSEALDLSKENVQPLRQGRKAARLETALQAQTNSEVQIQLRKERERHEYLIRTYEGDDPLQPYWEYANWLEQSYPKQGPENNLIPLLEDVITKFRTFDQYKQDSRYVQLVVKYVSSQSNALELYRMVYKLEIGKSCALLYKSWAEELDNNLDFKRADKIFQLGIKNLAEPLNELKEAHMQYQLSVGRRVLGGQIDFTEKNEATTRPVLSKLKPSTVTTTRKGKGTAGVLQPLTQIKKQNTVSAPVKVYEEGDEKDKFITVDENNKEKIPKAAISNKENVMKPNKWCGQKQKQLTSVYHSDTPTTPSFKVHEDKEVVCESRKTITIMNALKPKSKEEQRCPAVLFNEPDPNIKRMYPVHLVYAGGREFSLEEIRADMYWKKIKALEAKNINTRANESVKIQEQLTKDPLLEEKSKNDESEPKTNKIDLINNCTKIIEKNVHEVLEEPLNNQKLVAEPEVNLANREIYEQQEKLDSKTPIRSKVADCSKNRQELANETKEHSPNSDGINNASMFPSPSTSLTMHTKAALNVIQQMWTSPSPKIYRVKKNLQSAIDSSIEPAFKVPIPPKPVLSFPVFEDNPKPRPSQPFAVFEDNPKPSPSQPFAVFEGSKKPSDGSEDKPKPNNSKPFAVFENKPKPTPSQPFAVFEGNPKPINSKPFVVFEDNPKIINSKPVAVMEDNPQQISAHPFDIFEDNPKQSSVQPFTMFEDYLKPTLLQPFTMFEDYAKPTNLLQQFGVFEDGNEIKSNADSIGGLLDVPFTKPHTLDTEERKDDDLAVPFTKSCTLGTEERTDDDLAVPLQNDFTRKTTTPGSKYVLPYVPPPIVTPELESEDKENNAPNKYKIPTNKRRTTGVLIPAVDIQSLENKSDDDDSDDESEAIPAVAREIDFDEVTCNTKAFNFVLASSTPFLTNCNKTSTKSVPNSTANGSYTSQDTNIHYTSSKKTAVTDQNLSIILEASKEKYSSSSGSSGSSATCKTFVFSEKKKSLARITEQDDSDTSQLSSSYSHPKKVLHFQEDIDPFNNDVIASLLNSIDFPKTQHLSGYVRINSDMPRLIQLNNTKLGNDKWVIDREIGSGSYAKILKAHLHNRTNSEIFALKRQKPACIWEWYIVKELHFRLKDNIQKNCFANFKHAYIYNDGSILTSQWAQYGTILDLVTGFKRVKNINCPIAVCGELSIQMMSAVEFLHSCCIIHGDIKPDNFVLHALPHRSKACVQLIDFGRSIDMTLFQVGTAFTRVVTTDTFQCNEMRENKPWTYQTDLFGLAGSIYILLMGDYMKTIKRNNLWIMTKPFPRYMPKDILDPIFSSLLNIPSCWELPNLNSMKGQLNRMIDVLDPCSINQQFNSVCNVLLKR